MEEEKDANPDTTSSSKKRGRPRKNQNQTPHQATPHQAEEDSDYLKYEMMPEYTPVLRDIFSNHGDIVKHCSAIQKGDRKLWLTMVCNVVLDIGKTKEEAFEISYLESKLETLRGMRRMKVDVEWLITQVYELISEKQEVDKLEKKQVKSGKEVLHLLNDYNVYQQKAEEAKHKLQQIEIENSNLTEYVSTAKSKLKKKIGKISPISWS